MNNYYAVLGNPIEHSKSPIIHNNFAQQEKINITYDKILVPTNKFKETFYSFIKRGGVGANITIPCKIDAFNFADELSVDAKKANAVNTLLKLDNNEWYGHNTDGIGLVKDLQRLQIEINKYNILIIGAGGATRGIIYPILQNNPKNLIITNRTFKKAERLAKLFKIEAIELKNIENCDFDIIINATSLSLNKLILPVNESIFNNLRLAYDLVYSNKPTTFMRQAQQNGSLEVADGLGMLVYQAAESYNLWRNFYPQVENIIKQLQN